jgi:nitrilase
MSYTHTQAIVVAAALAAPSVLDRDSALERACELIVDAGQAGARWIVFPEAAIPGYPPWIAGIQRSDDPLLDELYTEATAHAVSIPSDVTDRLCRFAQRARINVLIGLLECAANVGGTTIYTTRLLIDAEGRILGRYRAPIAAGDGHLVWTPGDGVSSEDMGKTAPVRGI